MKPNIGISDGHLQAVANMLNALVADETVLYTKTRNAHWNIESKDFLELHEFFEGQYETISKIIDEVAERVRMLGHFSVGSLKDFLSLTRLGEEKISLSNREDAIRALLEDHETMIRLLRKDVEKAEKEKDKGTSDFLAGLMSQHEKMAWMLRSYIA